MDGLVIPEKMANALLAVLDGGSVVAVVTGVAKAFEWFDKSLSKEGRDALGRLLANAPPDERIEIWGAIFPSMIDRVFGSKAWSLKFFARSSIASVCAVTVTTLIWYRIFPSQMAKMFSPDLPSVGLFCLGANLIPDYISLLISRYFVRMISVRPTAVRTFFFVLLDTIITGAASFLGLLIGFLMVIPALILPISHQSLAALMGLVSDIFRTRAGDNIAFYVFIVASFFTSFWLWLYVVSLGLIRLLHTIFVGWSAVTPYLDLKRKPLTAIGRVAGLLAGAAYSLLLGFIWIRKHWQ